jgi:CheY-like chemotaxis protein
MVFLPRTEGENDDDASTPASAPLRGTETILLVEDEAAVRAVVRRMLQRFGYTVREAAHGAEALDCIKAAAARHERIDLVLTDVVMPEKSGRALGEHLREDWPRLRVLYMSGYTDDEILRRGLMQPGETFLEKPFTSERLASAVRDALNAPSRT